MKMMTLMTRDSWIHSARPPQCIMDIP